jgi:predicted RNA binding protein YcfA (HicA-like mRNA interferase family)
MVLMGSNLVVIIPTMKSSEVIKRLEADGWYLARVKGSHHHFKHPKKPGLVTVPHPSKDIVTGTLRSIFRQAGWPWT